MKKLLKIIVLIIVLILVIAGVFLLMHNFWIQKNKASITDKKSPNIVENIDNKNSTASAVTGQNINNEQSKIVGEGSIWPTHIFVPYVNEMREISGEFSDNGAMNLEKISQDTGTKYFNLSFIRAIPGESINSNDELDWGWGGNQQLSNLNPNNSEYKAIAKSIGQLRKSGGDVAISFGGPKGDPFWVATQNVSVLLNTYENVINTYGVKNIDFDLEGQGLNVADNIANAKAIKELQDKTGVNVSLTLGVLPKGMISAQLAMLKIYLQAGVKINIVNLMTMCYPQHTLLNGESYGSASISAITNSASQIQKYYKEYANTTLTLQQAYAKIGATPAIGFSNEKYPIFTLDWAQQLLDFAQQVNIGRISMWSMNRDVQTTKNSAITQAYTYTKIFEKY
ncbi:MAG: hypothetical protein ACRDDL_01995 [Sarcina sp.]